MSSNIANVDVGEEVNQGSGVGENHGQGEQSPSMAGQFETGVDADIAADNAKPKSGRKKALPKAAGAEEKPKTLRKIAAKKQGNGKMDAKDNEIGSTGEKGGEIVKAGPKKRGPKAKKTAVDIEEGHVDVTDSVEPVTSQATPTKKRTPKIKKESAVIESGQSLSGSGKKRASLGGAVDEEDGTPSKKPRASLSKVEKVKLPTTRSELTEADKLMLDMKNDGKTWTQINAAISLLTGLKYGKSTLGVRYGKIMDSLIEWKEGDMERMLFVREKVLQENAAAVAAFKKETENKIWQNMAKAMIELGADEYTPGAVEKAYNREKKDGFPHRSSITTIMAGFNSTLCIKGEDSSDAEDQGNQAADMEGLNLDVEDNMDTTADADESEV